jgi:uncharacterized membrane protein YuzA (DUF378 family)
MSEKTFTLVSIITTSLAAIAIGVIEFIEPKIMDALIPSISIIEGAIIGICGNFTFKNKEK